MSERITIEEGCDNVFADLGLPDAEKYMAKAKLAVEVHRIVESRGWSQTEAGKVLGLKQPKVSALFKGSLDGFSTGRLMTFLTKLGCDIEIKISQPSINSKGRWAVSSG